jgi:polyphosphate kinase
VIRALYRASQAGVPIDLSVRGICCLRPGVPGVSEGIRVSSVVGRFLEHSRVFAFGAGEEQEIYISSADWMPRNFYRRVEIMTPILDDRAKEKVRQEILDPIQSDNCRARDLQSDGTYVRRLPAAGEAACDPQQTVLEKFGRRGLKAVPSL